MRSTQDPIMGLKKSMIEWGVADEATLKSIDQAAKKEVDQAVVEAKECEEPDIEVEFWTDIYVRPITLSPEPRFALRPRSLISPLLTLPRSSSRAPSPPSCVVARRRTSTLVPLACSKAYIRSNKS